MDNIEKLLKDSNIVNIMNAVANRYNRSIDRDEIESMKCRDKYDPTRGAKFTSYLYQQLSFAFKNELKKKKNMLYLDNMQLDLFGGVGIRQAPKSASCRAGSHNFQDHYKELTDVLTGLPEDGIVSSWLA